MKETFEFAANPEEKEGNLAPTADEVLASALAEHGKEYAEVGEERLRNIIDTELERINAFEEYGKGFEKDPHIITPELAERIGMIYVLSGTGSYEERFKEDDNPVLKDKPWMGGWDRARMDRATILARQIAEVRSGRTIDRGPLTNVSLQKEETKELIAEYGPWIGYNGYPVENQNAREVLLREDMIIPEDRVLIPNDDPTMRTTADQARTLTVPKEVWDEGKEVAIISHAPHLARFIHILEKYKPLPEGSVPYLSPISTPPGGRKEFTLMEIRGLLSYIFLRHGASEEAHPHRLLQ